MNYSLIGFPLKDFNEVNGIATAKHGNDHQLMICELDTLKLSGAASGRFKLISATDKEVKLRRE